MTAATHTRPIPGHGSASRYRGDGRNNRWQPCRCTDCRTAARRQRKTVELRIARGGTARHPAPPVARHIHRLIEAGWTLQQIADSAHVDRRGLYNITHSRVRTVLHSTANKILALGKNVPGNHAAATGSMRRLRALAVTGWPISQTGRDSGISETAALAIANGNRRYVTRRTHQAISAVYTERSCTPGPSGWTRAFAASHEDWLGPEWWDADTLDDPTFQPTVHDTTLRHTVLAENGMELERLGYTREHAAERLGITVSYLNQAYSRWRKDQAAAAAVAQDSEAAA